MRRIAPPLPGSACSALPVPRSDAPCLYVREPIGVGGVMMWAREVAPDAPPSRGLALHAGFHRAGMGKCEAGLTTALWRPGSAFEIWQAAI